MDDPLRIHITKYLEDAVDSQLDLLIKNRGLKPGDYQVILSPIKETGGILEQTADIITNADSGSKDSSSNILPAP
jgi:hypothetical protein